MNNESEVMNGPYFDKISRVCIEPLSHTDTEITYEVLEGELKGEVITIPTTIFKRKFTLLCMGG
jgi:hypothetical protein